MLYVASRAIVNAVLFHFPVKRGAADAEKFGRFASFAVGGGERIGNGLPGAVRNGNHVRSWRRRIVGQFSIFPASITPDSLCSSEAWWFCSAEGMPADCNAPSESRAAMRSTQCFSSRTLPGQSYERRVSRVSRLG